MPASPLSIRSFPRAILHIDGDAFFASCEQSRNPALAGKPVITGKERGIVASMSYEAKARGVTRAMTLREVLQICPDAIILPSDYETYSLLSQRLYSIVRRFTPDIEEYGIDECFADITGMRRVLHASYPQIAERIQSALSQELGFTFSIGLGANKVTAKIASKWKKPFGLTVIPAYNLHHYLQDLPIEKIWGIGPNTAEFLNKHDIRTALEFARRSEAWTLDHLSKPFYEIWCELNGRFVMPLTMTPKLSYATIQKTKTFTPPSDDPAFVFAQLSKNIENACIKARRYHQGAQSAAFFLKGQDFRYSGIEVRFSCPTELPNEIIASAREHFDRLYRHGRLYRATGVVMLKLADYTINQPDLFGKAMPDIELIKVFEGVDELDHKYGKHTVYLGSSFLAEKFTTHLSNRGDIPTRMTTLFKGESRRKRLAIPMLMH